MAKYLVMEKNLLTRFKVVKIALIGLASIFEGVTGQIIVVDLILAPSHEMPWESIQVNTELGPS